MQVTILRNKKPANQVSAQVDEVKKQLGKQLDHLANVAADLGRDAVSQASNVTTDVGTTASETARDLGSQAAKTTQDVGAQAATVGAQAASMAREVPVGAAALFAAAAKGVQELGRNLRTVRITNEPPAAERGPDVRPGIALLAGFGGGLALMYFFDPDEGRRRRGLLRDQLTKWTRIGQKKAEGTAKDVRNRTVGVMHEAQKAVSSRTGMGDEMTEVASGNGYGSREAADADHSPFSEPQPQPEHSEVGM